ncbi:efflux RND transporter periplasmic adaptor subunit [Sporolituus thermophilus]|uniref:HlyD family secretion protein n=1 Tax=Sporolituus thermophilus DSM 23256 TaxID=1123285 RepID=A0A1G7J9R1_9FIRM|nr:efflux RND transporter periplasmic adaptor subunit [Sporolituus thermophilus]SDF21635.1 HlyD family secretion protein [Sporolituus thermophilus DSM 23256]
MQALWRNLLQHKKWWILLIVIAVAVKFGTPLLRTETKPAIAGRSVAVERGDITSVVSATGTIKPVNSVDISSKITGLIKEVRVAENEQVKAGQVLVVLDDTHLRALVNQAEARLANAAANLERLQRLAAIGAISQQQLDAARMDYNVAKAAYDDAQSQLEDTTIKAPIDGKVIGKPIPAGQTVAPGISTPMVLMTIADMSKMQIETQIDESDIGKVKVGQKATFTVDAYPGQTFTGVVSSISEKASIQQNVVYYPVIIDVETGAELLKPTMTARVSILVGESKNTLLVPLMAVKENKGQRYVQVLRDGQPQNIPVTTGLTSDDKIEITSGLAEGDLVLLPQAKQPAAPPNALRRFLGR